MIEYAKGIIKTGLVVVLEPRYRLTSVSYQMYTYPSQQVILPVFTDCKKSTCIQDFTRPVDFNFIFWYLGSQLFK